MLTAPPFRAAAFLLKTQLSVALFLLAPSARVIEDRCQAANEMRPARLTTTQPEKEKSDA